MGALSQRISAPGQTSVAIIGAGAGGLCMAIRLKQAGIPFLLFEKAGQVGGTWRDNIYPGSGCDIVSHLYSFSFEMNPDWNYRFAKQDEIQAYMEACVDKYGLGPSLRLNSEIADVAFDEARGAWLLRSADGITHEATCVVTATGQLNRPFHPDIAGMETFKGSLFHSARWKDDIDLKGKNIAVIGSGASAIQFLPEIAPQVAKLTLFQRSPNWVIPKDDRVVGAFEKAMFRRLPFLMRAQRLWDYAVVEATFPAFLKGSRLGRKWQDQSLKALNEAIADPVLRKALTPDYPAGCKRILLSNEWFKALARPNVEVVTAPIARIDETGVVSAKGHHPVDAIVLATGFEATKFLTPMQVRGLGGQDLTQAWSSGAIAHRGMTVAGFPNFFMLYGPNTNLGHGSTIFMLECQVLYIMRCLRAMRARKSQFMMVREPAMARYNARLGKDLERTVWAAGCSSWYKDATGRILNNWSGSTVRYWWETLWVRPGEYQFSTSSSVNAKPLEA